MSLAEAALRVMAGPNGFVFPARAGRLFERNLVVYRRTWLVIFSGFFEPLFYLLGIGFGVGGLVPARAIADLGMSYAVFVAPALMASSAMNGAVYDSMFNLFFKLKYAKIYDAVLATPVGVADIALGEVAWALFRGSIYAVGFIIVMAVLGLVRSPWAVLAVPTAIMIGFSFAAVGVAVSTFLRKWQDFDLVMVVLIPLFLFSGTFFPATMYPGALRVVVELTPLYHGVALIRGLTTGQVALGLIWHAVYLALLGLAGLAVAGRRLGILLLK